MKKVSITGAILVLTCIGTAQVDKISPPRENNRFGTFAIGRGSPTERAVAMNKLSAAANKAAQGCLNQTEVIALVDDSLSAGQLALYGWRIVTRIGEVATLKGCAGSVPYLVALPGIRYVKMPSRVYPTMDSARKLSNVNQVHKTIPGWTGPRLTGKGVLLGMIDTDFDTRHKTFQDSNGLTRFTALWDQVDTASGFPNSFGYGVIKNHTQILGDSMFGLGTDGHGTFTTSFAAGSDWNCPYYGVAPDAAIAGVKMGNTDQTIIDGLSWLFSLADSLHLPCVVNMSLGIAEGPHDGTSLVDRAIDNVSATPGHIVVGAAGNDGAKKEHVTLQIGQAQSKGVWLTPIPSGGGWWVSGIEMWGDSGKSIVATFNIFDTVNRSYGPCTPNKTLNSATSSADANLQPMSWTDPGTHTRYTVYFQATAVEKASPLNGKPHIQAVMYTPDSVLYFGASVSVPGTTGGTVQAWNFLQKSFRGFQVANYNDGDTVMSVNELGGTAKRNITVGSYLSKTLTTQWNGQVLGWDSYGNHGLNAYSGRGPTVDGRIKPDISAPGSNVAGAMPRFITDLSNCVYWPDSPAVEDRYGLTGGTSVAAPIVAGIVAFMLQIDSSLTVEQARTYLQETAIVDTFTGPITAPNNLWGAGKANALGVVAKMLNITANMRIAGSQSVLPTYRFIRLPGNRLKFTGNPKDANNGVTIELFSVNGRRIMQQLFSRNNTVVTLTPLSQGVYIVRAVEKSMVLCSSKISVLY